MSDTDQFDEATNLLPQPQPKSQPTGTPTWLWGILALLAIVLIAGAGFVGKTIEGNTKDETISAVENRLDQQYITATAAQDRADALQAEFENEQQRADNNEATAMARSTEIADSNATAELEADARATQEEIAANESAARETADAGSTAIAETAQADADARATAEAQAEDSEAARETAVAQAEDSAATAEAEANARATQEQIGADAQAEAEMARTEIAQAQATESALQSDLADAQATSAFAVTEVADARNAFATQEGRAIQNAGTASAAQIEIGRLQSTIDAAAGIEQPSPEVPDRVSPATTDVTTQSVRSEEDLYSIRLPRNWSFEEDLSTDSLSDFYFGQTAQEMTSMRSDDTANGVGGALFFYPADSTNAAAQVENTLTTTVNYYEGIGGDVITEPLVYTLADGRPMATQTVTYNSQDLYIYVVGMNRMTVIGLLSEPSENEGTWHAQLEQVMVSVNSPAIDTVSSGIGNSFDLSAQRRNLSQTVTTSDGRLTFYLPADWEFEDTFSSENVIDFSGDLSFGSVFVFEDEPGTFPENSAAAGMSLLTFGVNRITIDQGGHLLAEPGIYERSDGVNIVYCLARDSFGIIRWSAVYVVNDQTVAVAEVYFLGASTFPEVRDELLAIVLSVEYSGQTRTSGQSG